MKNSDFDKIFAGKLSRLPGEPYRKEGWSELSNSLDHHDRRRRWLLPVLLPLLLLLAGSNLFWYLQWRESVRDHKLSEGKTTIIRSDTIIHSTVVYRYDTVYQTITDIRQFRPGQLNSMSIPASSPFENAQPNNLTARQIEPAVSTGITPETPPSALPGGLFADTFSTNPPAGQATTPSGFVPDESRPDIPEQPRPEPENPQKDTLSLLSDNTPEPVKKAGSPAFYIGRPRLSLHAGWGMPSTLEESSGSTFKTGISADAEIARHVRLSLGLSYDITSLSSESASALDPAIPLPDLGQDFNLKHWEASSPAFSYTLSLFYTLPVDRIWSPWIGVGGQAATFLPYDVEFEFKNQVTDIELYRPGLSETSTRLQGALLRVGLDAQLNRHFSLGIEGFMLRRLGKKSIVTDNLLGLRTNLFYIF